jgi:EAL domain-containing protein (putative c-di-GMP-specific phosphodiesterase class I)
MKDFVGRVAALVSDMRVDPRRFELEITEGVLLGDDPTTHATLQGLSDMGFSLALDDFGTGYSSLSYLQRYPVDKIKIDRSFIANLGVDKEAEAVISAIVKLAGALNLRVIAEGVETIEQRDVLSAAGCREVQGYLYGKPMLSHDICVLLSSKSAAPALVD